MFSRRSGLSAMLPQVIFVMILAILLAVGLFLAIPYLYGREDFPAGTYGVDVEGLTVIVDADPSKEVFLVPLTQPGTGGEAQQATAQQQEPETLGGPVPGATSTPNILPTVGPTPTIPILPTAGPPSAESIIFIDYVVQPGDTLYSISLRQDTSIALMGRFGISAASLVPGTTIRLPVGNPASCPAGWVPYATEVGETAFSIATKCGTTVETFGQVNNLDASYTVYAASVYCVPAVPQN